MKHQMFVAFALSVGLAVLSKPSQSRACTAFMLHHGGHVLMAKSYDWHTVDGLLMTNKARVTKKALVLAGRGTKVATWTSRYGSITFNQYGRELPVGGMNEAGLAIEVLWLHRTDYGRPAPSQAALNELQWIQYFLDTCATVAEMIQRAKTVAVIPLYARVHYFACDRTGRCATFEYLSGRLMVHHGATLPFPVLTNHTYQASSTAMRSFLVATSRQAMPSGPGSLARFIRAAALVRRQTRSHGLVSRALAILASVRQPRMTKWQIIYDLTGRRIGYRVVGKGALRWVRLAGRRFFCAAPVMIRDVAGTVKPRYVRHWGRYSFAINRDLIRKTASHLGSKLPSYVIDLVARYPQTATCNRSHRRAGRSGRVGRSDLQQITKRQ
ncbi:MAG: linear amide C-N hydrolase [Deltaproteobacteria bacterium]|nr:linear amide C-N hydrolase [Deltaproteobacteria bacterium]